MVVGVVMVVVVVVTEEVEEWQRQGTTLLAVEKMREILFMKGEDEEGRKGGREGGREDRREGWMEGLPKEMVI